MLDPVHLPCSVDQQSIPDAIRLKIADARRRVEAFQDRWDQPQIEQFVAADYELVYQCLLWTVQNQFLLGRRFVEWGCGFAVVSALAETLDLDVVGIEAEAELLAQGQRLIADWNATVELVQGNFLPDGAETLADDPMLPSLGHPVSAAYPLIDLELDDFAICYAYPWPGEDLFHQQVFDRFGASGALLMLFCGPNDVRLWRRR